MQRSNESILVKMFTEQDHLIVKSLADMLIFGSEDPDKHVFIQASVCATTKALLKNLPHLLLLVKQPFDMHGKLLQDKSDMSLPKRTRVQRFWTGLKDGKTKINPIIIQ